MGGKPSKGTPRDRRLKVNQATRKGGGGGGQGRTFGTSSRPTMPKPSNPTKPKGA